MPHLRLLYLLMILAFLISDSNSEYLQRQEGSIFNISVVTWNLNERQPSANDCKFLTNLGKESDMIVIGVQECENLKPRRHEGSRSRAWAGLQSIALGRKFDLLSRHKIGGIQIAAFSKKKFAKQICGIQAIDVICGLGNVIANKGATALLFRIANRTLAFVNSHLAAHDTNVAERNENIARIMSSISTKAIQGWKRNVKSKRNYLYPNKLLKRSSKSSQKRNVLTTAKILAKGSDSIIIPQFDSVVFFGDLNYRLSLPRNKVSI